MLNTYRVAPYPDLLRPAWPSLNSSAAVAVAADCDQLLRPLSELEGCTGGLLTEDDTAPMAASCASARSLDTNFAGLALREDSSRGFDVPPGSKSRLREADGGLTGDIGGVFHAARTSSGV